MNNLVRAGFSEREAQMAMLTTSQFTIGCVMEEQTRNKRGVLKSASIEKFKKSQSDPDIDTLTSDIINIIENEVQDAFIFGLNHIIKGLKKE